MFHKRQFFEQPISDREFWVTSVSKKCKCETILMKMCFTYKSKFHANQTHFHMKVLHEDSL